MSYQPKVNDYVIWEKPLGKGVEGWVYFADQEYISIEIGVKCKNQENIEHCPIHEKTHCLVVCFNNYWNELKYVRSRECVKCE